MASHMWTDIHFLFLHSAIMSKIRRSTELVMMASSVSPPIHQSVHNFTWIPPEQKDSTQKLWTFRNRYIQLKFSEYYLRSTKISNTIYIGPHIKRNGFYAESTPTLKVLKKIYNFQRVCIVAYQLVNVQTCTSAATRTNNMLHVDSAPIYGCPYLFQFLAVSNSGKK